MAYPASAYLNLVFLFLGAALGSLACIIVGKVTNRRYFKFRLSLTFLLFAAAIAFVALMLLETGLGAETGKTVFSAIGARAGVLILYFILGALCSVFLRTVFPALSVIYIAFTLCFGAALYKQMPLPENIKITVSETFVRDEETGKKYDFAKDKTLAQGAQHLVFSVYNLNDNTVFLLPNVWYRLEGTNSKTDDAPLPFATRSSDSGIKKIFYGIFKKILGEARLHTVEVPVQQVYPSLFNLKINTEGADFNATLERIM